MQNSLIVIDVSKIYNACIFRIEKIIQKGIDVRGGQSKRSVLLGLFLDYENGNSTLL
jgi:hypothetical protein